MPPSMSRAEREEFLAGVHVGVLSVASGDARGPLAIPGPKRLPAAASFGTCWRSQARRCYQLVEKQLDDESPLCQKHLS